MKQARLKLSNNSTGTNWMDEKSLLTKPNPERKAVQAGREEATFPAAAVMTAGVVTGVVTGEAEEAEAAVQTEAEDTDKYSF